MWHEFSGNANILECYPPTFVVKEPLHLHGRPRVSDAEHGAGNDALLSRGTVRGPHQAPVGLVVEPLQDLHSLTSAHRELTTAAITGYEVVDHHCQFTATGELQGEQEKSEMRSFYGNAWKPLHLYKQKSSWVALTFQEHHQKEQEGLCGAIFKKWLKIPASYKDSRRDDEKKSNLCPLKNASDDSTIKKKKKNVTSDNLMQISVGRI